MNGCPFCDYEGPSPILREYADDVYVIEPLNPVTPGHLLVIPFRHYQDATEHPGFTSLVYGYAALEAKRLGLPCNIITSVGLEATQTIFHLHVHLVPRREGDGLKLPWS